MRRDWVSLPLLFLCLLVFGTFAWLTQHPDSELLRRGEEWPVVGPLAKAFRARYLPTERSQRITTPTDLEPSTEWVVVTGEIPEVRPWVWIREDTVLYREPSQDAEILETIVGITNLPRLDRRGDWFKVTHPGATGWVYLEGYDSWPPIFGSDPEPVLPLPPQVPSPDLLAYGLEILGESAREGSLGPYSLYTDSPTTAPIDSCDRVAKQLESAYRDRYGLALVGEPAEVVFIFRRFEDFAPFRDRVVASIQSAIEPWADGFAAAGLVAAHIEGLSPDSVCTRLAHELTHLLNRRGLGPALPPWLDEGLADDLAGSMIDAEGRLHPGKLGGEILHQGDQVLYTGARAAALGLLSALDRDELLALEELTSLDRLVFYSAERLPFHYAQSSFWVRYLLSGHDSAHAAGFRAYLADVARGHPLTEELLLSHLGQDWPALDQGFRFWLRLQMLEPPRGIQAVK